MTTRTQLDLAFLGSPACHYYSEAERLAPWTKDVARSTAGYGAKHWRIKAVAATRPEPRTEIDRLALLGRLARGAYTGPGNDMHAGDVFRADLLVKAMSRPGYWGVVAAAKRLAAYEPAPGIAEVVR